MGVYSHLLLGTVIKEKAVNKSQNLQGVQPIVPLPPKSCITYSEDQ